MILYAYSINNLIFPKSLQILRLYDCTDILDYDFNHELHIITFVSINNPKFKLVQINIIEHHYIYLKWLRSHFIKAVRI